ncbi:muramoyltetrapeptide carboxypeptidase LdcA involved in peptidoglycan recycling [Paenibacillus anaericanus]|uniref:S66 family peptidase n=1 Tax=Paenibacillus anaericanus TaxID=170367 RepID=UPI0027871336|nr:S66 peptidase family protein [Paenibacillus anaericanus]MDQ0088069.1 muramoyltetrapeptide carboxypeptidase LdcA involved in peptidoglycan recycling [Paenibacillus anaericanus]
MIKYPFLKEEATIGITAPSSGVGSELHGLIKDACNRMNAKWFNVICGETVWTQDKAKSSPAKIRATELNDMMQDDNIHTVIPPWGGELLIEVLEYIDFENIKSKWILGYSDISVLLLATTLKTGIATAHGPNLIDLRGVHSDETTAMWQALLSIKTGESIIQHSSQKYQKEWNHDIFSPCVFHLTEQTYWKVISDSNVMKVRVSGRLLGGCVDVIRHLIGTPFGDVQYFQQHVINNDPILWYLENCELTTVDLRRSLVQMKLAGWFENCSGIMFGRSEANQPVQDYTIGDVYEELSEELQIPIIYDIDCGHVPPQMTFINGAYAEVEVENGKGTVKQYFNP